MNNKGCEILGLLPLDLANHEVFCSGDINATYDVEKEPIARGKFASVRLARERSSGQIYAAKYIRRRRRASSLEGEARHEIAVLLLGRSDPHIVHLHEVYETRSEYIILLEYGEGGDLQRLLDDQIKLSELTARDIILQVLQGLIFLHQRSISHLDIKPQNLVMMTNSPDDGVKLVDFGLSRVIIKGTELTQIMGTPDYVAPEVINYEPVSLATDMWAIGVLAYVFLTGCTPFGGNTDQETFVNITQGEYDFPEELFGDVSELAKDFISSLLVKNPNKRMTAEESSCHPWMNCVVTPLCGPYLSEPESVESGYSTEFCNGSPPMVMSNGYVRPAISIMDYAIPEEQTSYGFSSQMNGFKDQDNLPKNCASHLSINVMENIPPSLQKKHHKPQRRSSLVIDNGPRYSNENLHSTHRNRQNGLYSDNSSHYYKVNDYNSQMAYNMNGYSSTTTLPTKTKSREEILTHLFDRLSQPKKHSSRKHLGVRPDLSYSMFELQPKQSSPFPPLMKSETTIKLTRSPKSPKANLRLKLNKNVQQDSLFPIEDHNGISPVSPTVDRLCNRNDYKSSISDVKSTKTKKSDVKISRKEINNINLERPTKSRIDKSIDAKSNFNSNVNLQKSNLVTLAQTMMTLSQMNLSNQSGNLPNDEERDLVYGDYTLPRRASRGSVAPFVRGNSFHMSYRLPKKKDGAV